MILYTHIGNILENVHSGIIVHGCNSKGVMESGIAKTIKDKWPVVFDEYVYHKKNYGLGLGSVNHVTVKNKPDQLIVVNAITQEDYGTDKDKVYVSYAAIENAFIRIGRLSREMGGIDIHFPKIGAGRANGDWEKIIEKIGRALPNSIRAHLWVLPEEAEKSDKETAAEPIPAAIVEAPTLAVLPKADIPYSKIITAKTKSFTIPPPRVLTNLVV